MLNRPIAPMVQRADVHRQSAIDEIGRQMDGNEEKLEAAGEEAEHKQNIAAMAERFRESLGDRLLFRRTGRPAAFGAASTNASGTMSKHDSREDQQRLVPAEFASSTRPR